MFLNNLQYRVGMGNKQRERGEGWGERGGGQCVYIISSTDSLQCLLRVFQLLCSLFTEQVVVGHAGYSLPHDVIP